METYDMRGHHDPQQSDTCQVTTENCGHIRGDTPLVAARQTAFGEYEVDGTSSCVQARDYKDATDLVISTDPIAIQGTIIGRSDLAVPQGRGTSEDGAMFTLTKTDQRAVAFNVMFNDANGTRSDRPNGGLYVKEADTTNALTQAQAETLVTTALALRQREGKAGGGKGPLVFDEHSGTLATVNDQTLLTPQMAVRRLLPVETERLQGLKDGHTNVPYRNKPTSPDGPRYKAIGNSMATNCMEWIGHRIEAVETQ